MFGYFVFHTLNMSAAETFMLTGMVVTFLWVAIAAQGYSPFEELGYLIDKLVSVVPVTAMDNLILYFLKFAPKLSKTVSGPYTIRVLWCHAC